MQHSQLRKPNEKVKLFAKTSSTQTNLSLTVFEFKEDGTLSNITPSYTVKPLNQNYFSTEIVTPDHSSYLLILFCGNPIVLRVGEPKLQFFFWSEKSKPYPYTHYDENGQILDEGTLKELGHGFHYTSPVSDVLGYIEVLGRPYIIHVPYCSGSVGVGIDIDWKKTIKRRQFGLSIRKINFKLNNSELKFEKRVIPLSFSVKNTNLSFSLDVIMRKFKISCKG